jgi:DNA-binding transcriptional regulator YiaG
MKSSATRTNGARTFSSSRYLAKLMAELDRAAICARIAEARETAGLTQPELAEVLEPPVHWRTVQTWESLKDPRVPWDRLDEIARVTGRTKEWLLHGEETVPAGELTQKLVGLQSSVDALDRKFDVADVGGRLAAIEEAVRDLRSALSPTG